MATTANIKLAVEAIGGTFECRTFPDKSGDYLIDAPSGHVWAATGTHSIRADYSAGSGLGSWKPAALAGLAKDIAFGLDTCDGCDSCDGC